MARSRSSSASSSDSVDSEATNADSNASSDSSSTESNGFDSSDSESNNSDDSEDNDGFHKRYNGPDADVILLSDDGIKFRVHSVLLKASSKVLVDKLTDAGSDPIALTAHSKTLALLLDFLYPTSRPSLPRPATLEQGAILADFANELGINHVLAYLRAVIIAEDKYHASPVDLYVLACKWGWTDVAALASTESLKVKLSDKECKQKLRELGENDRRILKRLHRRRTEAIFQNLFPLNDDKSPEVIDNFMSLFAKFHSVKEVIKEDGRNEPEDERKKEATKNLFMAIQCLNSYLEGALRSRPLGDTLLFNICSNPVFTAVRKPICPMCDKKYLDFDKLLVILRKSVNHSAPRSITDILREEPVQVTPAVDSKKSNKRKRCNKGCHERYNDPDADLLILTEDNVKFRVNSFFLKTSSQVFRDMFQMADQGPIPVSEDSELFALLLDYIHPTNNASIPDIATIKKAAALVEVARKYDIPHVMASVRTAVLGWMKLKPVGQSDAEQLYILGCKWRWEDVAVLASESLLLFDGKFWEKLLNEGISNEKLLKLRDNRERQILEVVTPYFISDPSKVFIGKPTFHYFANCYCIDKIEVKSKGKARLGALTGKERDAFHICRDIYRAVTKLIDFTSFSLQFDPLGHSLIDNVLSSDSDSPFTEARKLVCPFCKGKYFNFNYIIEMFCNVVDTLAVRSIRDV